MPQSENRIGIDPATSNVDPSFRAVRVTVTERVVPCIASRPVASTVKVLPTTGVEPRTIGAVRLKVASRWAAVSMIWASCGCGLPPSSSVVRSTLKDARRRAWLRQRQGRQRRTHEEREERKQSGHEEHQDRGQTDEHPGQPTMS